VKLEDRIFLTSSHPEANQITYTEVFEYAGSLQQGSNGWRPLITGLKYPTYTAYDFHNKWLYVCDCDEIL